MEKKNRLVLNLLILPLILAGSTTCSRNQSASTKVDISLSEGTNMAIAISPDGKSLALDLQGTIWIMPSTGGMAKPVTDDLGDCHEPNWSPDGELIAFHSYRSGTYHIWTVRKDGNDLRQITSGNHDDREPCWSPDGRKILFSSDRKGSYDIWQNDLITNELNQLTSDPANEYNPSVSSDGQMIAFVSEGKDAGICILREDIKTLLHPSTLRLAHLHGM